LGRFKLSGEGSASPDSDPSDELSAGDSADVSEDSVGASDDSELSDGASDDDPAELVDEAPACGFSVLAPQADTTIPATASPAITEVRRENRDIGSYLSAFAVLFDNPPAMTVDGYGPCRDRGTSAHDRGIAT
jgi:hypothetical protein